MKAKQSNDLKLKFQSSILMGADKQPQTQDSKQKALRTLMNERLSQMNPLLFGDTQQQPLFL
jgi:hypothetical protein